MARTHSRIIVSGMIAGSPFQGGASWAVLQYVLGLQRLGHDVFLIEPVEQRGLQPEDVPLSTSVNASYFRRVLEEFGLEDRGTLLLTGTKETVGLPYTALRQITGDADLLFNVSGMLTDETLLEPIRVRVYLDLDPGFIQLWHATQGIDMRFSSHHRFVTVGLAIGSPDCPVPACGLSWIPTPQPVVLERWPVADRIAHDAFTTVGNWRGYGSIEHEGVQYGQKAHSLRQFFDLPELTGERFELALAIHPAEALDLKALHAHGWTLLDPVEVAGTPGLYRQFIQGSRAEFGIAKSGYVAGRTGWFSDRSACYLASGRPVVAQDTGFSHYLPTGEGLFAFSEADDVIAAVGEIRGDYPRHTRAARALADEIFDSDRVLSGLLERLGAA